MKKPLIAAACLVAAIQRHRAAAGAAERIDPPGRPARRSVLSRRRLDARAADRHGGKSRVGRFHPLTVRAHGLERRRPQRIVFPVLQPDDGHARPVVDERNGDRGGRRPGPSTDGRPGVLPAPLQRDGDGERACCVRRLRHQRAAPSVRRLQRRREGQDRARARSRTGRTRSQQPLRWCRHLGAIDAMAQGARGAGERGGRAALRRRRPQPSGRVEFRGGGAQLLAGETAADSQLHAGRLVRSDPDPCRADFAGRRGVARRRHRQAVRGDRQKRGVLSRHCPDWRSPVPA